MTGLYLGPERRREPRMPRAPWRVKWCAPFCDRLWWLIAYSNTQQTRFLLALAATLWVLALLIPGDSFSRTTFVYMRMLAGENGNAEARWTFAFALYAGTQYVLVFADINCKWFSVATNGLGVVLFTAVAYCVGMLSGDPFPAGVASHAVIALAAVWVALRSHVNSPPGWRHD